MLTARKIAGHSLMLGHGLAIACAACGLALIIVAPLDSVIYGIVLLCTAIALDMIVAVHCPDSHNSRRRVSSQRSRALHARKRQPARH